MPITSTSRLPRIALTPGEPAGIGPDLCVQIAGHNLPYDIVAIGSETLLAERAERLGIKIKLNRFDASAPPAPHRRGELSVLPVELIEPVVCGQLDPANSRYVLATLDEAVNGCISGLFDAMTTGPVHKGAINAAGIPFTGHTEYIAEMTGGTPVMMLATPGLRVALATTHLPLAEVSGAITPALLRQIIGTLEHDLRRRFALAQPKILVCGLNPHAGENGYLGREEIDVIEPVLDALRKQGMNLLGPLPADTLFTPKYLEDADAVLAMYHDQGLPVLKHKGFGQAVNITLGLPIIRTSVDHGTALDLAGSGQAETGSLLYALQVAAQMAIGSAQ